LGASAFLDRIFFAVGRSSQTHCASLFWARIKQNLK
jgi:hypothetical protein